ncbi:hypothetical protein CcaverHIS002_0307790 [Cutaneotrichosporon cavernicola]|uniref:Cation/H+ exchanger transmembrane domain-containing protein n=1 Tax=Cutaneotrichosporon cavernicola TaxID=279322 RepID=A0AA48I3S0_9TREE|nr:uncharacterized protein CcaverHIS019_0307690 [Cutaneotrichosporon cavernicola]BEI82911.1 hypothetical protein CcaverHIS002_0307790 [Cutaneotrichosporon cavernicola]BEI90699.1 hypothetical protein CcaverHIS019_0307690 [Cutaneotrichosporon cavernicola]BEI98477.1 hypothetical protein CcaverHIS631_0307760 [Cutaneotrichosporon cavernicola]BEJ06250.1 hypothetical protein CcaverHIS641_0307720 [Cutaneotrichosporon cavernicola]
MGSSFHPFDVDAAHLAYTILGGFTVLFGLFSLFIKERLYLGEAPLATVVGIICGRYAAKIFDPISWGGKESVIDEITLEVTRVVIALGVFSVGVELPKAYVKKHWRTLFFLLGPCMIWGWLVSALFIWGLVPKLTYKSALVISACLSPTDPILAQAVVGGTFAEKHVPTHIRHMLSAESGVNDGAAFPFLYIALYLTLDSSPGHAVAEWFYMTWLYEVCLGTVIGGVLGYSARKVMQFSERKKLIDRQSYVAQYVSLSLLSIGICTLLGSDDLLAAFACGTAFAWDGHFNKATEDSVFSNVVDLLFNCAAFIYIGAIIPFADFNHFGLTPWRLVVITLLILLFRRLPIILALYKWIPDIKTFREALFSGWFGPMGVGAIFISTLARHHIPHPEPDGDTSQVDLLQETIVPVVSFLVLASVVTHGLSIPFFVSGRRVQSMTYTWSRNPSIAPGDEPAWTTHTTRVQEAGDVVVNRDTDEGDIGMQGRPGIVREKRSRGSSGDSSGTHTNTSEHDDEAPSDPPTNVPRHAVYREGQHLVTERTDNGGREVHVNVERNVFRTSEEKKAFDEDGVIPNHSLERVASIGAPMRPLERSPSADSHSTNAMSDVASSKGDGFRRRPYHWNSPSPTPPAAEPTQSTHSDRDPADAPTNPIHSYISADRVQKKQPESGWRRVLRTWTGDSSNSNHSYAEEGRAGETGFLPARTRTGDPRRPSLTDRLAPWNRSQTGEPPGDVSLTRTISFAPQAAPSSDVAPSVANYGSAAPGFKKTPSLGMFRTSSIRPEDEGAEAGPAAP